MLLSAIFCYSGHLDFLVRLKGGAIFCYFGVVSHTTFLVFFFAGLERQVETLKERAKVAEAEVVRSEKRYNASERARQLLEQSTTGDLEAMHSRMAAMKERAEVFSSSSPSSYNIRCGISDKIGQKLY